MPMTFSLPSVAPAPSPLGVLHTVLGVLHTVLGVLHTVLGVLHAVLGYHTGY